MLSGKNMKIVLLLLIAFIYQINTLSTVYQDIIHEDSEYAKVCTLDDKNVLVLSSVKGIHKAKESLLDKKGNVIYGNAILDNSYSSSAQLVQPHKDGSNSVLTFHNRQKMTGSLPQELVMEFKQGNIKRLTKRKDSLYQQKSTVSLKSGKVLTAGINPTTLVSQTPSGYYQTTVDVNIFDPTTNRWGQGSTFSDVYSQLISCVELKPNEVYCFYICQESDYVSKLRIKHIKVNDATMAFTLSDNENKKVIKTFYTVFKFIKAVPINEKEAIIVFQTGNGAKSPKYGNSGKDLYYYHLVIEGDSVTVKRYEYLYNQMAKTDDPEDYKIDVAVLNGKSVYVACEADDGERFRGFILYLHNDTIHEFNYNNFYAESVKNPQFAVFDKSLGLFYTQIMPTGNSRVAYQMINYPDCNYFGNITYKLPKYYKSIGDFSFAGRVFMNNPYPANRAGEEIQVRIQNYANLTIKDRNNNLLQMNKDYPSNTNIEVYSNGIEGDYAIEITATRQDELDGLIEGRTCKINFYTPKCLVQCYSCSQTGNENHHYCLGCKNESYYMEEDPAALNEGYGKPHFCRNCNISCSSCHGPFMEKPETTTNCKKCKYEEGYYHYEHDNRTCISYETQEYWESVIGHPLYLDKTPGEAHKEEWRWKFCHPNCKKCSGPGTDEDNQCDLCYEEQGWHFFCNQTIGHGIPGSCHPDCEGNGFFIKESENMTKCCPCFDGCRKCENETYCDKCWNPHYLLPDHDDCVDDCPYCLAKDNNLWECVNCKTRYSTEKYHLNQTCYDEIPIMTDQNPDVNGKPHHIIDDTCNLLKGCKEGCFNCTPWYSENCTKCKHGFYKEDFYGKEPKKVFPCFKKEECEGTTAYQFNKELRIGGIPKVIDNEGVCYNCKLREGNYRQVNRLTCGAKAKRTFINVTEYNALAECYLRCSECEEFGNSCFHNCTACREPGLYELVKYNPDIKGYGNCVRYAHKCKDLPYYHDYDLAEENGIDEDSCGQDCDVCLENRTCTENFPFYVVATRECVEICPFTDILSETCLMNHTRAGFILLQNPFDLENPYTPLNKTININKLISSSIFQTFIKNANINLPKDINTIFGNGHIYNLENSQIIVGNNITIEISSVKLELQKLTEKLSGTFTDNKEKSEIETSIVDFSKCSQVLKNKYGISEEEDLIILKGDILKQLTQNYFGNQVEYQILSSSLGALLPLTDCKEQEANIEVTNLFDIKNFVGQFKAKTDAVVSAGYNAFDSNSPFYNDVCTPFTNENGNDVLLDERRTDYFNENINLCDKGCNFIGYNATTHYYTCNCSVKDAVGQNIENKEIVSEKLPEEFYKKHKNSNIEVMKCASQVFSSEGQKKNYGSYALILCFSSFIGVAIFNILKGPKMLDTLFNGLSQERMPANPPVPAPKEVESTVRKSIQNNVKKDDNKNEEQLTNADFNYAKEKDTRGYLKIYWSYIKLTQICIFTFYTSSDYNLRIVKIAMFILFLSFYFAFTALFFNDSIMRSIYIYKGNTDAVLHVPNIILSSLCSLIMSFIVRFVSLSERDITKIFYSENNKDLCEKTKKALKIKLTILLSISGVLIALCWYYVSAFCAVFKNSQGHYFVNVFVAFIVCNLWPFVTKLIPTILRKQALKKESPGMYKASQILGYF